jgi:hypothetical protein
MATIIVDSISNLITLSGLSIIDICYVNNANQQKAFSLRNTSELIIDCLKSNSNADTGIISNGWSTATVIRSNF